MIRVETTDSLTVLDVVRIVLDFKEQSERKIIYQKVDGELKKYYEKD